MNARRAFTLIELLVVIAIIGIVATLVVHMSGLAGTRNRQAAVEAEKHKLMLMIDNYYSRLNFYPLDNGNLANAAVATPSLYDGFAATNPLVYELTGATNNYPTNGYIQLFDGTNVASTIYSNMYDRGGIANANQDTAPKNFFYGGPRPQEYAFYTNQTLLKGLVVPVPYTNTAVPNFWHYDSSSPNRHNQQSYDLWAEYGSGSTGSTNLVIITNGNW